MRGTERTRATELRVSLAVFFAIVLASYSLHVLLDGVGWWFELALTTALVVGAAALTRAFTRRRYIPTVVASVVFVAFVVVRFAADTAVFGVLPGLGTLERIVGLASGASASIRAQSVPVNVDSAILLLLVAGVGIIAIAADLLAVALGRPALAGIPLLVIPAVPGLTDFDLSDGFAFALAAAGFLWLVLAAGEHRRLRLATVAGTLVIAAALVVPLIVPPSQATGSGNSGLVTGVNPTINLGRDLISSVNTTALVYSTNSGDSEYLRMVTLDDFSGQDWAPTPPKQNRSNAMTDFAAPPGLSSGIKTTTETTKITIGDLQSPWLPLPYPTSRVTGLWGNWYWEPESLAVSSPTVGIANQNYQVTSLTIKPTPEQLTAAGSTVPAAFNKYLALPSKLPAVISDTAKKVAGGEQGSYAKAIALQQYFLSGSFTYSVNAPVEEDYDGTSMSVVAKFLSVRSGYCVHFASAMAVMARTLGIPARIGVGFQPGHSFDSGVADRSSYKVTSHDLHAWPELYFDKIGWVRFEPTPGRGTVPSYADLDVAGVPAPLSPAQLAAQSTATPDPSALLNGRGNRLSDLSVGTATAARQLSAWLWVVAIIVVLLFLLLLPALRRRLLRSGRIRAATAGEAWREILATAEDLGFRMPATLTPREIAATLGPAVGSESLERLRSAVERESFAAGSPPTIDAADVRVVTSTLAADATPRRRILAGLVPASVWRGILKIFRRGR